MDEAARKFVLDIIDNAKDLTLATVRPDGYPQATTVSYAHDGMTLYVGIGKDSQKAANIRYNNRVSLTINSNYDDWKHIKGLSMSGVAEIISDPDTLKHASECMLQRFPQVMEWVEAAQENAQVKPEMEAIVFLKIEPQIVSILDYEKGFGHTELVTV